MRGYPVLILPDQRRVSCSYLARSEARCLSERFGFEGHSKLGPCILPNACSTVNIEELRRQQEEAEEEERLGYSKQH